MFREASLRKTDPRVRASRPSIGGPTPRARTNLGVSGTGLGVGVERRGRAISSPTGKQSVSEGWGERRPGRDRKWNTYMRGSSLSAPGGQRSNQVGQ